MPDLHAIEKKVEYLCGRLDEIQESGMRGVDARLNALQDRMNRQELYIKELLQASHADRLNFVESLRSIELSFVKMIADNIKVLEMTYKQDKEKQSGFNMMVAQKLAQGAIVAAVVWFVVKDMVGR